MKKVYKILLAAAIIFNYRLSTINSAIAQDAEYNLIRRTYKINSDGTMDIGFRKEIKLLRNRAITAYADKGETFILYNPSIDKLTINESYTIRKDGSRVQTPANAFIDQLPSQCQDCGRYNGIRERAVIHTALEYDCIIVLDYTIHRKGTYLDETIILNEDCPVKKYEVIINVPNNNPDVYSITHTNGLSNGKINVLSDANTFHCIAKNLPQNYNDSYLPDAKTLYPFVHLTYGTNGTYYDEFEKIPEAVYLVGELYDKNPLTYAINIRDYVIDYIRTTDFPMSLVNYNVSTATETFLSACGTPADKKRLMLALMHEAGFKAHKTDDHIIVSIKENGNDMAYILSTTDKRPPRLDGTAIDEQRTIEKNETIPWQGNPTGGGYSQMTLPTERGSINIDPSKLTSSREAPIKVRNCNEKYHYTILLPRTPKRTMVGKPINISYTKKGVGSIKINIKQLDNGAIDVVRELNIDVLNGIVLPNQYKAFRQLMQDWNKYNTITIFTNIGTSGNQ